MITPAWSDLMTSLWCRRKQTTINFDITNSEKKVTKHGYYQTVFLWYIKAKSKVSKNGQNGLRPQRVNKPSVRVLIVISWFTCCTVIITYRTFPFLCVVTYSISPLPFVVIFDVIWNLCTSLSDMKRHAVNTRQSYLVSTSPCTIKTSCWQGGELEFAGVCWSLLQTHTCVLQWWQLSPFVKAEQYTDLLCGSFFLI